MSYNRKALKTATNELGKAKAPSKPKDIITDPMGQWKYPGQNTRIPGSDITMQGVDYPVWAQPNVGQPQMMYPGQEYQFPGADYVDEFPQDESEKYYEDELDEEQIAELRAGGYTVEDISVPQLTQAQNGITISDPKKYAYRKGMYDDSLNLYKENAKWQPARDKALQEHIKWTTSKGTVKKSDINKVVVDNKNKSIKLPSSDKYASLQNNIQDANQWNKINKKIKPTNVGRTYAANKKGEVVIDKYGVPLVFEYPVYKKPVQAIYKPGKEPTLDVENTDKESINKESISLKTKPLQKINIESNLQNEVIPSTYSKPKKYNPTKTAYRSQTIMEPDPDREGKYRMKELRQVPYATTKMYRQGDVWENEYAPRVMYTDAEGNETEERPALDQQKKGGGLKKYSRSLEATNKLFHDSPLLKKAKSKKKKIFDPKSNYFDVGGIPNLPLREGRKAYERLGYTDNDRMAMAEEGGFLPQAQAGKATTSLIFNPYEQGMFNTNVHAQGSNKPSFGFGVQRSNMFPRWSKENDVQTSMSGQVQIPYAMDRGPAIKGTARTAYSPNAGRGTPLDFTTQAQLEAGYSPDYGFNTNVMAWPYIHGSNVPATRWKENKYYPGALRAGVGPQAGFSYAADNKTFNGNEYMTPNRAGVHYGGKGFVEYTPTDWLKLKLEAQGMFDPIANKRDENAEIEGTKWKFSPGVNVSATMPLNFNRTKVKPNLQRKAQVYNDDIDGNFVKEASTSSAPMWKNGGNTNNDYIEIDADDNDIANYIAQGYEVEELPQAQYAGQTPFVHPNAGATQILFQKPAPVKPNSKYDPKAPVNYQAKLKPIAADNTRTVVADEALAAVQNAAYMKSPEYKAKQKAEKEAQAKFEKEQWAKYNKMSFGEKVLDRTNAALNQPLVMASNLLMGEQAYIPGMAEGLGEDNINYDEYLKATGQSRGLSVNDVFNTVNPGNWGGHAGREYGKGNYVQGAAELGLGLLGLKGAPMGEEIAKRYADKLINLEKKLGTDSGVLSNAHKLNPWAFKANPENIYRGIGKGGVEDAFQSGVIRNNPNKFSTEGIRSGLENGNFRSPYFVEGKNFNIAERYANGYIAETPLVRNAETGDLAAYPAGDNWGWTGAEKEMPLKDFNILKKHWLKGYKEVPKQSVTKSGLLSNTYKVNPFAFKANPKAYYRGIGKLGLDDALQSGVFRQAGFDNKNYNNYKDVWYATGNRGFAKARDFSKNYIAEVPRSAFPETGDEFFGSLHFPTRGTKKHIPITEGRILQKDWLRGYKEVPKESVTNTPVKSGIGGMDMSRYEIKNPDYFTQLLDTYDSKALSSTNKKFYKDLIGSVKKQNGLVTERQYNELQRLKTGNFNFGKKGYKDGGSLELDLSPDEIQTYIDAGYTIEDID